MNLKRFIICLLLLFVGILAPHTVYGEETIIKSAIIIDDFGGGDGGVMEFLKSDIPITVAVMPFAENSIEHAMLAHKNGFEIMVHLPMQPKKGKKSWLGPKPITIDLPVSEVKRRVTEAIESVPYAKGLNNHMGSLVVENEDIVRAIVEVVKQKDMYIVDSGTSPKSKFPEIAEELSVPILKRDIFLDDVSSVSHVSNQMLKLAEVAEEQGAGIAIGHVGVTGKVCYTGISQSMKQFKERNIEIVPVSDLIDDKYFEFE
ncbi:divergent polysaccharide deacetylase family protein [Cytobacillus sp. IB215665]|uniref:divergent polysaccharide deacetylase family protein n=1 Tax=Cytobacillus sp. IB215665 TaxID=3097357 RepID=UPI002A157780|nr:divergent polysaccharide deacetylase family protein [Cytobacillus sp. IB215665]MDX8366281.1 divergent polysaccharide deacetylase family protein [Cytobacillus sp. IB215665]